MSQGRPRVGRSRLLAEDAAAVTEAFADATHTTGEPPLALSLDNKPSNYGEALGDTLRIRPRPDKPTDKP